MQFAYSIITEDVSPITIFSSIFSLLSIIVTLFEYFSSKLFLETETVLIVKLTINSSAIANLSARDFNDFQNLRFPICSQLSKIIDIDVGLIELLKPKQTRDGCDLTFHIRIKSSNDIDLDQENGTLDSNSNSNSHQVMSFIKQEIQNRRLEKMLLRIWNDSKHLKNIHLHKAPKIVNVETKELKPDADLRGKSNDIAAVINMSGIRNELYNQVRNASEPQSMDKVNVSVEIPMNKLNNNHNHDHDHGATNKMAGIGQSPGTPQMRQEGQSL